VEVELPVGTPVTTTMEVMQELEARVRQTVRADELQHLITVAGPEAWWRASGSHEGALEVILVPVSQRQRAAGEVAGAMRQALAGVPGASIQVREASSNILLRMLRGDGDRLAVEIRGHDLAVAEQLSRQVMTLMRDVPGVADVKTDREEGKMERTLHVDRARLADLGLTGAEVAATVEHYVLGKVATRLRQGGDEFDIRVQLRQEDRDFLEQLPRLPVITRDGRVIPLASIATIEARQGPASIAREDQQRIVKVNAGLADDAALGDVVAALDDRLAGLEVPDGFAVNIGGEYLEQQKIFADLSVGILLALFLVYTVMAVQFESLRHPLIIMTAVPFSLIGVVLALALTATTFNMNSFLGMIVLVGIVVNNAIVLVDYVNLLRREHGRSLVTALLEGGRRRLRPILMTTLTTALGLLPLAIGLGEGSEIQAPLARVVVGGLLSSTLITLFFVPSLYLLLERRRLARAGARPVPVPAEAIGAAASRG
jgi:HAE1 family hydrophobic/amphiphilic exporter-1